MTILASTHHDHVAWSQNARLVPPSEMDLHAQDNCRHPPPTHRPKLHPKSGKALSFVTTRSVAIRGPQQSTVINKATN